MSTGSIQLKVLEYFNSDEPIRPRSKIPRRRLPILCFGFCWPRSVPDMSASTGLSVGTVRDLYFDLRELLLDPRYRKWHSFNLQSAYELDPIWDTVFDQLVWSCYAECSANQECQRNFRYGKRATRECTTCPILNSAEFSNLLGDEFRAGWLRIVDRTREFYLDTLKMRQEFGLRRDVFKRRVYHQQIVNTARANSAAVNDAGVEVTDHLKEGPDTVRDLWTTLLNHIEERGGLPNASD